MIGYKAAIVKCRARVSCRAALAAPHGPVGAREFRVGHSLSVGLAFLEVREPHLFAGTGSPSRASSPGRNTTPTSSKAR